jgi:hypothetical protein
MWVIGQVALCSAIVTANVTLMLRFHNYTGWGEIFIYGSILSFFSLLYLEGLFRMFNEVFYIFDVMFTSPLVWIVMLLTPAICNLF